MEVKLHAARSLVGRLRGAAAVHDGAATAVAIAEIRHATKDDPDIRAPLADAGAVPFLAAQLTAPSAASEDAAAALLNISISARGQLMSAPGLLDALTAALRADEYCAAHHAAATVYSLLCVEANRPVVGARRPLLAALVSLLRAAPNTRATKDALKALFAVALHPPNRATLVGLGAVQALFALIMTDGRSGIMEDATAVVAQVAGCAESLDAFTRMSGLRILVDLVEQGGASTPRTRENAAAALLNLVVARRRARRGGGDRGGRRGGRGEGARGGRHGEREGEGEGGVAAAGVGVRRREAARAPARRLPERAGAVRPVHLVAGVGVDARVNG
ncbi:hypothetical protein OsJ_04810 [Oryza sativa Japonica Group]|uniref:U-box domain-containing protein n=1 Tax=Oryza sativa subsp. japonica TaxID=39947 RepID=A3A1N2_ORYSJ|nr:hypothetical protein OsJ_04810 [Oryza sativa Japonica Group]